MTDLIRPPLRSFIDPSIATNYDFSDQHLPEEFDFLARQCVAVRDGYKIKEGDAWVDHGSNTVRSTLERLYCGLIGLYLGPGNPPAGVITPDRIGKFLGKHGGLVRFQGTTLAPGLGEFVLFEGERRYINTWRDRRLAGCPAEITAAEPFLRIVRENLCRQEPASLDAMLAELWSDAKSPFRWAMHWLTCCYTRPGFHIGTMLWFLGPVQGIGKGSVTRVMNRLIGQGAGCRADASEMKRGWTSFMLRGTFVEYDEVHSESRKEDAQFFKHAIGNRLFSLTRRHLGTIEVPNVWNWYGESNRTTPLVIDGADRRHTLIATETDLAQRSTMVAAAKALWNHANGEEKTDEELLPMFRGIAATFLSIEAHGLDLTFIRAPLVTELREDLVDRSRSLVVDWFEETDADWAVNEEQRAMACAANFFGWAKENGIETGIRNPTAFSNAMREHLIANGYIEKKKSDKGNVYVKLRMYHEANQEKAATLRGIRKKLENAKEAAKEKTERQTNVFFEKVGRPD